ncbi:MAG: Clp protease N-terminal domain-containing protein [Armatimonas sp.]
MWQRFTERARRVIFYAQEETGRLGENYVSTEHILLGIVREDDTVAARILDLLGVSRGRIRAEVERQITAGEGAKIGQDMQLTPRAKRVIDLAYEEARELRNNYIGTEHLLLGLIREGEGVAGRVLSRLGIELERARQEVRTLQAKDPELLQRNNPIDRPLRLDIGVLGELRPQEGREVIEVAWTEQGMVHLAGIFRARDGVGYENMVHDRDMALLPAETEAKLIYMDKEIRAFLVRLRSGEHDGKTAWVFPESFVPTGEDDAPFPPKVELKL